MNWQDILKVKTEKFPKDSHGLFSASNYHWLNYSIEKMISTYNRVITAQLYGTKMHELAASLIELKQPLRDEKKTLNMYVNDAIRLNLIPEKQLYYSEEFRGTADAIGVTNDNTLLIHDLKTGQTKASLKQLEIYTALFCLDYGCEPHDFTNIILRIYQNDEIIEETPDGETIIQIMDKIVTVDKLIQKVKESNYERLS